MRIDARIPVRFIHPAPDAGLDRQWSDQALLLQQSEAGRPPGWLAVLHLSPGAIESAQPHHRPGCRCCVSRPETAVLLTRLLHDRARGCVGFFRGVVASLPQDAAACLRTIIAHDPYLSGCFANVDQQQIRADPEPNVKD